MNNVQILFLKREKESGAEGQEGQTTHRSGLMPFAWAGRGAGPTQQKRDVKATRQRNPSTIQFRLMMEPAHSRSLMAQVLELRMVIPPAPAPIHLGPPWSRPVLSLARPQKRVSTDPPRPSEHTTVLFDMLIQSYIALAAQLVAWRKVIPPPFPPEGRTVLFARRSSSGHLWVWTCARKPRTRGFWVLTDRLPK